MTLSFYKKNDILNREDINFLRPIEIDLIKSYSSNDVFDRPFVGDVVVLEKGIYKVFKTFVDYVRKEIYIIVEEL